MNHTPNNREVSVSLLSTESSKALLEESGITSITFYSGDVVQATSYIRTRFKEIVDANPWLAGRVIRNSQHKHLQLVHPAAPVSEAAIEQLFHPNPSQINIGSEMSYAELCKAVKSAIVIKGRQLVNKPDPLTRITNVKIVNQSAPFPHFRVRIRIGLPMDRTLSR